MPNFSSPIVFPELIPLAARATTAISTTAGAKLGAVFRAPKTGSIAKVYIRSATVSGAQPMRLSLQDVDMSTGNPDGTVDQSATITPSANAWLTFTLDASRSVTKNDYLSYALEYTGTVGTSFQLEAVASTAGNSFNPWIADVYSLTHNGTSWTKTMDRPPLMVLEYSDGTFSYAPGIVPGFFTNQGFNSGSSPNERGVKFTLANVLTVDGVVLRLSLTAACDIVLYDASSNVLRTVSLNPFITNQAANTYTARFSSSVSLSANTVYRIGIKPTTTTSVTMYFIDVNTAAWLDQAPGGTAFHYSERTGSGAWTDTTTRKTMASLLVSGYSGGGGSIFQGGVL